MLQYEGCGAWLPRLRVLVGLPAAEFDGSSGFGVEGLRFRV